MQGSLKHNCSNFNDFERPSIMLHQISSSINVTKDTTLCNTCFMLIYNESNSVSLDNIEQQLLTKSNLSGASPKSALKDVFIEVIKMFRENKGFLLKEMYDYYCTRVTYHLSGHPDVVLEMKTSECKAPPLKLKKSDMVNAAHFPKIWVAILITKSYFIDFNLTKST